MGKATVKARGGAYGLVTVRLPASSVKQLKLVSARAEWSPS